MAGELRAHTSERVYGEPGYSRRTVLSCIKRATRERERERERVGTSRMGRREKEKERERGTRQERREGGRSIKWVATIVVQEREEKVQLASAAMPV